MADAESTQPPPSIAGPSRTSSRNDMHMEGVGKFKLSSAPPTKGGSSYKAKFFVLKDTYDQVTARQEDLRRELDLANSKLKAVQSENDLLLDAMKIVVASQPGLVAILQQMDPDPGSGSEMYPEPLRQVSSYVDPPTLPEHQHRQGPIVDAAALNGNGNGHGYTHHAPVRTANGRTRGTREYQEPAADEPADQEMLVDDDAAERDLQHEHQ